MKVNLRGSRAAGLAAVLALAGCAGLPYRPVDAGKAQAVLETAQALAGRPYRFGGEAPDGFDCSGFVRYVYLRAAALPLPHSSRRQFRCGWSVPMGYEAPSDLIFFSIDGSGPSHVGIYLGRGRFIHAPGRGDKVKISDANEPYWRQRFIGLRRVLN